MSEHAEIEIRERKQHVKIGDLTNFAEGSPMLRNELGRRVRELREARGLKQPDLGEVLGKTATVISKRESGASDFTPEEIDKLSRYFNVSLNFLFGREDPEEVSTLTPGEQRIIELFRECNEKGKYDLLEAAVDCWSESKRN